jgi:predicted nucleic acid-binding protein
MKPPIIADSSGLVSLISEDDSNHNLALKIATELSGSNSLLIVPSDVFSETLNVIGKQLSHELAIRVGKEIINSSAYSVIETSGLLRDSALSLFSKQAESVSFTDCVVMVFVDNFKARDIFGFDKSFKANGYRRLGFDESY